MMKSETPPVAPPRKGARFFQTFAIACLGALASVGAPGAAFAQAPPADPSFAPSSDPGARPLGVGADLAEPVAIGVDGLLAGAAVELGDTTYDIPGQIVVDANDSLGVDEILGLASDLGLRFAPTALEGETRIQVAEVPVGGEAAMIERLMRDPRVEYAEPLARVKALFIPDDPLLKDQWHMERIGASRAWDFATGQGITVAVVDTGIACEDYGKYTKGTDLAATRCVEGYNFVKRSSHANDDHGHGTHVAGTIAQSTNNGLGAAGVAFRASLMPVKVLSAGGWGTTADVADGIRWAADHGAHVINLSLGSPRNARVLQSAITYAIGRGSVVVAAAGNTGGRVQYPGASDGVIGVSATDSNDKLAAFSSRGEGVDIAAPGVNVVQQTVCNGGLDKCERFPGFSGTSMAAPHVAGAAALVMSLGVSDPAAVEAALRGGARVVDDSGSGRSLFGAGILDAAASAAQVTTTHVVTRLLALLALTYWVARGARQKNREASSVWSLRYLVLALAAGPGLFFFAPWVLPRTNLAVDLLSRPIPDMDLYVGLSLHKWLPLANALVPLALTLISFGVKAVRPAIAGLSVGIAAYLASLVVLGDASGPFGHIALVGWAALNIVACLWIARTNLAESA